MWCPRPSGKLAGRKTRVDPGQDAVLRKPELPLIAAIVALRAEHEFMDAIVEPYSVKQVEFDGLHCGRIGRGWNVEPKVPEEIRALLERAGRMLPVEETVIVLALAVDQPVLSEIREVGRIPGVGIKAVGKRSDASMAALPAHMTMVIDRPRRR